MSLSPTDIISIIQAGGSVVIDPSGEVRITAGNKGGNAERCRRYRMSKHVESMSNHVEPCRTMSVKQVDLFGESEPLKPHRRITWTPEAGWQGVTDEDRKQFAAAAPAVDIERALSASSVWLTANPAKAKANHYRFFVNWIARQQERGGDAPKPDRFQSSANTANHAPDPKTQYGF